MSDNVLIDTNIWVYLYALNPQAKREKARQLIDANFQNIVVSSQILGEHYHVPTRKGLQDPGSAKEIVVETVGAFSVSEVGVEHVLEALSLHQYYGYSYWDSLVIATALFNGCAAGSARKTCSTLRSSQTKCRSSTRSFQDNPQVPACSGSKNFPLTAGGAKWLVCRPFSVDT
jgi:predicted nucleic acid-binding protein